MREFWLATDHRSAPARIYRRDDVVCLPVPDLPPCRLAVMWRTSDRRRAVRVVADTCCRCMAADQHFSSV